MSTEDSAGMKFWREVNDGESVEPMGRPPAPDEALSGWCIQDDTPIATVTTAFTWLMCASTGNVYETTVSVGHGGWTRGYRTRAEAVAGHAEAVAAVRRAVDHIAATKFTIEFDTGRGDA